MTSHPNRSKTRPVATCTDRAVIIGQAANEAEALVILRAWAAREGIVIEISGAKIADVMIDMPQPGEWRFPKAWIPIPAQAGLAR